MTAVISPPTRELVQRAAGLVPLLRSHADWGDENRRLHEESVEAMTDAGLFKMRVPERYGGYENSMRTVTDVLSQIGRADGSTSWVASIWSISTWIVGLFPDEAQDEIFSAPNTRVCGILSTGGMALPDSSGGVRLSGKWAFNTGVLHSHWDVLAAVCATPDGTPQPVMVIVPVSELSIVDDWFTSGLRGTGSVSTVAEDVHVPAHRVMPMGALLQEQYGSVHNLGSQVFRTPLVPTGSATVNGTVLGLAQGAMEVFRERLPGRGITYTGHTDQSLHPLTHLQLAEATMKIDEAEFHANRAAELLDSKGASGEPWAMSERALVRLDSSFVNRRAKEAADVLNSASGGSANYTSLPMQRIVRDLQAVNLHALMNPNTNLEMYGRVLLGLDPNTHYI